MIKSNYSAHLTPQLHVLSEDQVYEIHLATLEIMQRTGVDVYEKSARDLLKQNGCLVKDKLVRFPSDLVERCIATAPERISVYDRNGRSAMLLEGDNVYFGTGSDCPYIVDTFSGERRATVNADIAAANKIADALENIDFCMSMAIASDHPQPLIDVVQFVTQITNTTKPIVFVIQDTQNLHYCIEMARAVAGGAEELKFKPFAIHYSEPTSPLKHPKEALERVMICAREGIPIVYTPAVQAGATGPITMAGALVCANAELLSGLVIHQLTRMGAPFISGGIATIMDMKTANYSLGGSPEWMLGNVALKELTRFYKLPVFGTAGNTDSKVFDQQAALEAGQNILVSALAGSNLVHDVGYMECGLTASWDLMVAGDDMIGLVRRFMQGISVNEETLAVDIIDQVGPGGQFLMEKHTLKHLRSEHWMPRLLDRQFYAPWKKEGALTMGDRARNRVKHILETHTVPGLPEAVGQEIDQIMARVKKEILS